MSKRILVVEDQEDNRQILRDLLGSVGYQILEAEDGARGVATAEAERPDLILMDIQLPLIDGYEATRRIKANPALRAIPIIVVTSYALSGDEDKARAAGCDDYITKPYSPRALLAKINEHLRDGVGPILFIFRSSPRKRGPRRLHCHEQAPPGFPRSRE